MAQMLDLDTDATPKCDVTFDVFGCWFGIRVEPGGIRVLLTSNRDRHIARGTLPGTIRSGVAFDKAILLDSSHREIDVSFDGLDPIGFGDNGAVPRCLWHS